MPSGSSSRSERVRLWLERARHGYRLRDAATEEPVRDDDPRVRVVKVAGVSYRLDTLQDDAFSPGRRLALVPEPDNEHDPHAIGIWDAKQQLQAGYVPAETARELDAEQIGVRHGRLEGNKIHTASMLDRPTRRLSRCFAYVTPVTPLLDGQRRPFVGRLTASGALYKCYAARGLWPGCPSRQTRDGSVPTEE